MSEHTNSNGALPPAPTLSSFRLKAMEASNVYHQEREQELEQTRLQLDEARVQIRELETEVEGMRRERVMLESRATLCLMERDRAKDDQISLATILNSVQHLLQQAGIPSLERQARTVAEAEAAAAE